MKALGVFYGLLGVGSIVGATGFGCGSTVATPDVGTGNSGTTGGSSGSGSSGSGSSSGGEGGGGSAEYAEYCQALFDRDVKCKTPTTPTQVIECEMQEACDNAFFRDGVMPPLHQCLVSRDCNTGDDQCYSDAAAMQKETAQSTAYGTACKTKVTECGLLGMKIPDDHCVNYTLVRDEVLNKMTPCFAGACDKVNECVLGVVGEVYKPCATEKP